LVGLFAGTLLVAYLYPWRVGMLISPAILVVVLFGVGRPVEQAGSAQVRALRQRVKQGSSGCEPSRPTPFAPADAERESGLSRSVSGDAAVGRTRSAGWLPSTSTL
jgi:hypothetical protein